MLPLARSSEFSRALRVPAQIGMLIAPPPVAPEISLATKPAIALLTGFSDKIERPATAGLAARIHSDSPLLVTNDRGELFLDPAESLAQAHIDQNTHLKESLASRVKPNFIGFNEARFGPGEYAPSYEMALRDLGADIVIIENPEAQDLEVLTKDLDFHHKPEKIMWRRKVETSEDYMAGLNSKHRTRIKSKLKASESSTPELETMTMEDYREWYPLYEKEVVGKEKGRRAIDADWSQRKNDLSTYRKLFFRDPETGAIIGGAILHLDKKKQSVTIAYAAYDGNHRDKELSVRTFFAAMEFARLNGYTTISYGMDTNFYGHHLSLGLMEYKAGLGFTPIAGKDKQLVKILNPEKLDEEYYFFTLKDGEKLTGHYFSDEPHGLSTPKNMENVTYPRLSEALESEESAMNFLSGVKTLEQAKALEKLYLEFIKKPYSHYLQTHMAEKYQKDPQYVALTMIKLMRRGKGNLDLFIALAKSRGLITASIPDNTGVSRSMIEVSNFSARVATALSVRYEFTDFWKDLFIEILGHTTGEYTALETANGENPECLILDVLNNVERLYGRETFVAVLTQLDTVLDLSKVIENPLSYEPASTRPNLGHLSLLDLDYEKYFPPQHVAEAKDTAEKLYRQLFAAHIDNPYGTMGFINIDNSEIYTQTVGGKVSGLVKACIEQQILPYKEPGYPVDALLTSWKRLQELRQEPITRDDLEKNFIDLMARLGFEETPAALRQKLLSAGIRPDQIKIWGRSAKEIYRELYQRGSLEQVIALLEDVKKIYSGSDDIDPLIWQLRHAYFSNGKSIQGEPLETVMISAADMEVSHATVVRFIMEANDVSRFTRFWASQEGFDVEIPGSVSGKDLGTILLQTYLDHHGKLPEIFPDVGNTVEIGKRWQRLKEYARVSGDNRPLCSWVSRYPTFWNEWTDDITHIVESFSVPKENYYYPEQILFLLKAAGDPLFSKRALTVFEAMPQNIKIMYGYMGRDSERYRELAGQISSALAGSDPVQFAKPLEILLHKSMFKGQYDGGGIRNNADRNFAFAYDVLKVFGQPRDVYWSALAELATIDPQAALMCFNSHKDEHFDPEDISGRNTAVYQIMRTGLEPFYDGETWRQDRLNEIESMTPAIAWPESGFAQPNSLIFLWAKLKLRNGTISPEQVYQLTLAALNSSRRTVLDETVIALIALFTSLDGIDNKQKKTMIATLVERVKMIPLEKSEYFARISSLFEVMDPMGEEHLNETVFGNSEFLINHPWQHYGYSEELIAKIKTFTADESFTGRHASLLGSLLFSHNDKVFNKIWITQLLLSTPDKAFHTLIRFLQYWQSLTHERRDDFLNSRVENLLADTRIHLAKDIFGPSYEKVKAAYDAAKASPKGVSDGLRARMEKVERYRELFTTYNDATTEVARDVALQAIHAALLIDQPLKLNPAEEQKLIIEGQNEKFLERAGLQGAKRDAVEKLLNDEAPLWKNSGIGDRFVQYAGFAEPQGLEMLSTVLRIYSDPHQARVVAITRPDMNGMTTRHFDYFGKFVELADQLKHHGLAEAEVSAFMAGWSQLWSFDKIDGADGNFVSVTHDLERWVKHGEDPTKSCQRISDKSGNMGAGNWNYKYGANPNSTGRPLARFLLPQLKLAELRQKGQVTARATLEVTVEVKDGRPQLALLVEAFYGWSFNRQAFETGILRQAAVLGIPSERVYFADHKGDVERAPQPLPEKYRIYRDSFRPK